MNAIRPRFGEGDAGDLPEWRVAATFSQRVTAAGDGWPLPGELEWLRYLVTTSGGALPAIIADAWEREYLAEYLLGLYEALDHVALLEYYLLFLRDEGLLPASDAGTLDEERADLQATILAVIEELRPFADQFSRRAPVS